MALSRKKCIGDGSSVSLVNRPLFVVAEAKSSYLGFLTYEDIDRKDPDWNEMPRETRNETKLRGRYMYWRWLYREKMY
jgi:hypothetical protein